MIFDMSPGAIIILVLGLLDVICIIGIILCSLDGADDNCSNDYFSWPTKRGGSL